MEVPRAALVKRLDCLVPNDVVAVVDGVNTSGMVGK